MDFISSFRQFRGNSQDPSFSQCVTAITHWLQMSICSCTEPIKCGGRNPRVLHEAGFFKIVRREHCRALRNITQAAMICQENTIHYGSWAFVVGGLLYLLRQMTTHTPYGRYVDTKSPGIMVPARAGWFIQELPSFLVPVLLILTTESLPGIGRHLLLWTFCLHYFQR